METLTLPDIATTSTGPKLLLLETLHEQEDWRRWRIAGAGALLFHFVVITALLNIRYTSRPPRPPEQFLVKHVTPLYLPPQLTQKAPNKTPLKKELTLESIAAKPILKAPSPAPAAKQAAPAKQMPMPPVQSPQAAPKPLIAEAPKIDAPPGPQPVQIANNQALPPPPSNTGPPKLVLEDVAPRPTGGRPAGGLAMPNTSVQEAVKTLTRNGGAGASVLGDTISDEGQGLGMNLPPSAGRPQSSLQLKSDPMGVDFRPYMIQVLASIRRAWFAVYPEAAKTGMRGQVVLQFRIDQKGNVLKLVFNGQTPSKPLNEAAVAAVSASLPMPPFPTAFKGDHVDLQMSFLYNMPK
jgi:TonB family protein